MENSMSRILVSSVLKNALRDIKENPDRSLRNLVDMACRFSEGRFQERFFATAQTMLQNEHSAYYKLLREVVAKADSERLYTFGMNLGYNCCTEGAQRIRESERRLGCNIPWILPLVIDTKDFESKASAYHAAISSGERLGIYAWIIFCKDDPQLTFELVRDHPDSAFFLFCEPNHLTESFIDEAYGLYNLMLTVRFDEDAGEKFSRLRDMGLLCSAWTRYNQKDLELIMNGDLFYCVQQLCPIFTVLMPDGNCPDVIRKLACQAVRQAREKQLYHTVLWEIEGDNCTVDKIISDDDCYVYFDSDGNICDRNGPIKSTCRNIFRSDLKDILENSCPKKLQKAI